MEVGGGQGNTYNGSEGYDLAFKLADMSDTKAPVEVLKNQIKKTSKPKENPLDKWKADTPDFFWVHETEMQSQVDKLMDFGAELMEAGIDDPTTSKNAKAIIFQKEMAKINRMGEMSEAIKNNYTKDRATIHGDKDGQYDKDSKLELMDFYEKTSLGEIVDKQLIPPLLKYSQPKVDLTAAIRESSKSIDDAAGIDNHYANAQGTLAERPEELNKLSQVISELSPQEQVMLKQQADKNGMSPEAFYYGNWSFSLKHQKPEDLAELTESIIDFDVDYISSAYSKEENKGGGDTETVSGSKKYVPFKNVLENVKLRLSSFPNLFEKFEGNTYEQLARNKNGTLYSKGTKTVKDQESLAEFFAMQKWARTGEDVKSGRALQLGVDFKVYGGKAAVDEDLDLWIEDLSGRNGAEKQQIAASWMSGRDFEGVEVSNANFEDVGYFKSNPYPFGVDIKLEDGVMDRLVINRNKATQVNESTDGPDGKKRKSSTEYEIDPVFIDVGDKSQFNRGRLSDIYYDGIKVDRFLYKDTRNKQNLRSYNSTDIVPKGGKTVTKNTTEFNDIFK